MASPCPPLPAAVAAAFATWPGPVARQHRAVRALIFDTAEADPTVGPLTETLKWGEPAYLTQASRSGSTIRLGLLRDRPGEATILFNCRTILLDTFRARFPELRTAGDRAVLLPVEEPLPTEALSACLHIALTYHRWRRKLRSPATKG